MRRAWRIVSRGAVVALGVGVVLLVAAVAYVVSVDLPPDNVAVQTSFVYDRNDVLIAELSNGENRQSVTLAQVPPVLVNAVIAAEDRRFYEHSGIDPVGVARALLQDIRQPRRRQGGSTITQQYVKNVYVGRAPTFRRKLREAAMAVKLERKLTKDQILERYLNTIYFGRGAYGVQLAARSYFGKDVGGIDLAEAAYLAALIRGPESTDARRDEQKARSRRSSVLTAMVGVGSISAGQAAEAELQPLIGPNGVVERKRRAAYTRPEAGAEFFVDLVKRDLITRFGEAAVTAGGLRVKTTLDLGLQARARRAMFTRTLPDRTDPDAAAVTLNQRAEVLVLVGGRDFTASQVNLAVGAGGGGRGRAAGSTFKPFVAAAMLRKGYSMESAFKAPASLSIEGADVGGSTWNVANHEGRSYPTLNVLDAMRLSVNTVFARIVTSDGLGPQRVADEAGALGITSPLQAVGSIALGTQNVGPLEMANAYLTFANRGMRSEPQFVLAVSDSEGRKLRVGRVEPKRVMKPADADVINRMLRAAVDDGTGAAARAPGMQVAGKTGTTNDYNDAWFVGYTPMSDDSTMSDRATECCAMAVWMGYADGVRVMTDVHGRKVTGGSYPAELFSRILIAARNGDPTGRFAEVRTYRGTLLGGARRRIAPDGVASRTEVTAATAEVVSDTSTGEPSGEAPVKVNPSSPAVSAVDDGGPVTPSPSVNPTVAAGEGAATVVPPTVVPPTVAPPTVAAPTAATLQPVTVGNPPVTALTVPAG